MIGVIGAEGNPVPLAFFAATVKMYCALFVKFVIVWYSCVEANGRGLCATPALKGVTT